MVVNVIWIALVVAGLTRFGSARLISSVRRPSRVDGDAELSAALLATAGRRVRHLGAVVVDRNGDGTLRMRAAQLGGSGIDYRFEIGSVTKAITGLLVADGIDRGELSLDMCLGEVFSELAGSPCASLTLSQLCTHTAGLPRLGGGIPWLLRSSPFAALGLDPYRNLSLRRLLTQTARLTPVGMGRYRYSNLGGALAGQMIAAIAEREFAELLTERILAPAGMESTFVSQPGATAGWGRTWSGLRRAPWKLGAYAPAGGVVSTVGDMGQLITGLLAGTVPGARALVPVDGVPGQTPDQRTGLFWVVQERSRSGVSFVWHNGGTGGYSAFIALRQDIGRAVVTLADVDRAMVTQTLALDLLFASEPAVDAFESPPTDLGGSASRTPRGPGPGPAPELSG